MVWMKIYVLSGTGQGSTLLSAFDAALHDCGVSNYNLIQLSSIIPANSTVTQKRRYVSDPSHFGHRLYVVKAEKRSQKIGKHIAAGIGWYQLEDGRGMFVEHEEVGDTKVAVESALAEHITHSLKDLCAFRSIPFKKANMHMKTTVAQVVSNPTCVLVLAVYTHEAW
jgi:arginine decarboxylase